uniref:Putative secreted protein n=1 Tax=Anopheles darlingi TaxID=43151 RepID=A0A2M4D3Z1_ANODA
MFNILLLGFVVRLVGMHGTGRGRETVGKDMQLVQIRLHDSVAVMAMAATAMAGAVSKKVRWFHIDPSEGRHMLVLGRGAVVLRRMRLLLRGSLHTGRRSPMGRCH